MKEGEMNWYPTKDDLKWMPEFNKQQNAGPTT
jgi:hypothetical protein